MEKMKKMFHHSSSEVKSPTKGRRATRAAAKEDGDARAKAINDAHDALEELEAMERPGNVTPPPLQSPRRNGPAAGTAYSARALELKDVNEKAVEAETKAAKLAAELEKMKDQIIKEKRKREQENPVEVSTQQQHRQRTPSETSRKKAVSAMNYCITLI